MADYISDSACRGIRPRHLSLIQTDVRRFIIAKMMKERTRPQILIAPTGFGKTLLVDQYAQLMHSYWHVIWLDCQDLRFIRMVQDGTLYDEIMQRDEEAALVVFDDVPVLERGQAQVFAKCMQSLSKKGCTVLACMTPLCWNARYDSLDAKVYDARALMVQSSESIWETQSTNSRSTYFSRIPALAWQGEEGLKNVIRGYALDELPLEAELVGLYLFAVGSASAEHLAECFGPKAWKTAQPVLREYALFDYDAAREVFRAPACTDEMCENVVLPLLYEALYSLSESQCEEVRLRLVNALMERESVDRAALAACILLPRAQRLQWLLERAEILIGEGRYQAVARVCESFPRSELSRFPLLEVAQLFCSAHMGELFDDDRCLMIALAPSEDKRSRIFAALMVLRRSESSIHKRAACELLATLTNGEKNASSEQDSCDELGAFGALLHESFESALSAWRSLCSSACSNVHVVKALWLAERQLEDHNLPGRREVYSCLSDYLHAHIKESSLFAEGAQHALTLLRPHLAEPCALSFHYQSISIPTLRIRLWGSFKVYLGDRVLDESDFTRRLSVTLLALLAMEPSGDLNRDCIVSRLWPKVPLTTGRHRLSNILRDLKRTLALPDGTCPYLIIDRTHLRLDFGRVECDTRDLVSLCRVLHSDRIDVPRWTYALEDLIARFSGEFMPGDGSNQHMARYRLESASSVVDSLVHASTQLMEHGEPVLALRFGREALQRNPEREDAYALVMRAQIAAGQRASALGTYFACRRYLSEELGLDPSPTMVSLYENVLDEEGVAVM